MIAAFIGDRDAAKILADMTHRQESIFGGFYSGIATLSDRKLFRARTVGPMENLQSGSSLNALQGTVGIALSRTNDGGGIEWSQPRFDDEEIIASVGVGIGGVFSPSEDSLRLARKLLSDGVKFRTRTQSGKKNGVPLPDGSTVHGGEVYLLALAREYRESGNLISAVRALNVRSESVGLYLCNSDPGRIHIVNHNQRVVVGRMGTELFVVTSRLALVESPEWSAEIPMNTYATVSQNGLHLEPLWMDEPRFDWSQPSNCADHFLNFIRQNPGTTWYEAVTGSLDALLPKGNVTMSQIIGHRLLESLLGDGSLRYELGRVEGIDGQTGIPQMQLFPGRKEL